MTTAEFSNEFDILYNNIMSNAAPGVDNYEKSVFLTKAQSEVVKNYFNPKGNKYQEGFDSSPKRQIDFSKIIKSVNPSAYSNSNYVKFDDRSMTYIIPSDILTIISETIKVTYKGKTTQLSVIPINYLEYLKFIDKPYKLPYKNQAWRILQSSEDGNTIAEIITVGSLLTVYKLRYVIIPPPIILEDLTNSYLSIDGKTEVTNCILDEAIHSEILQRAVELAKNTYMGDLKSSVELGQRSE